MQKTVCELFAGVGGFRLGFERQSSSWQTVWFSQWEPSTKSQWAHKCYVSHWGDIDENTNKDISLVCKSKIPNHNLLVGGFPCQDYSVARPLGGSTGIEGKKGVLWWQIRDILIKKKPKFVLLENVDRLLKSPANQRGRDFGVMLGCFKELGYDVEWRVINAADYGSVQRRRRTFIFAYKKNTDYAKRLKQNNNDELITDFGFFATTFPIEKMESIKSIDFSEKDILKISEGFTFDFKNAGCLRNKTITTGTITPKVEKKVKLKTVLEKNPEEKFYITDNLDKWEYLKGSKHISRTAKTGYKYIFSEGAISFPDDVNAPARTMLTSEGTVNRSSHVVCDPKTKKLRRITPLEAERIQGFDDGWTNTGMPERARYFCMGNALVVPMITRMATTLEKIFNEENGV